MGEFAKGKIDDVIKLLNSPDKLTDKEIQHCENIVSIIGEPIIKNQLRRMLDSKRLKKIDNINKKIEEMEYELKILKENQNRYVKDDLNNRAKKNYYTKKNTDE